MAARLGARRDIATRYSARGDAIQLGRAVGPAPENETPCWSLILCCPCKTVSCFFTHLFRNNMAAAFFYIGILGSGCGYGTVTYICSYKINNIICFANLTKWIGRWVGKKIATLCPTTIPPHVWKENTFLHRLFSDIFSLTGGTCASIVMHFSSQLACNFTCTNALGICEPILKAVFYLATHVAGVSTCVVGPW